jgi:hypothetical protein
MSEAPWTVVLAAEAVNDLVLITDVPDTGLLRLWRTTGGGP